MARRSHNKTRRRNRGRFGLLFKLLCLVALVVALTAGVTVFFRVEAVTGREDLMDAAAYEAHVEKELEEADA